MRLILLLVLIGGALVWMIAADVEPIRTYASSISPRAVLTIDSMTTTEEPILTGYEGRKSLLPPIRFGRPEIVPDEVESITLALINQERTTHGGRVLIQVEELTTFARSHSEDMATRGYFSHDTPEGLTPRERASIKGVSCWQMSENIYAGSLNRGYTNEELAQRAVESWMGSTGHRRNILDPLSSRAGVGVAISDRREEILFTQVFC